MVEAVNFGRLIKFFHGKEKLKIKEGGIEIEIDGPELSMELAYEAALIHIGKTEQKKIASNTLGLDQTLVDAIVAAVSAKWGGK